MSKYTAHYWRYGRHETEDFDTLAEAKEMLAWGEDYGELTTEIIETPDGVIEGDELAPILGKRTPGCHAPEVSKQTKVRANASLKSKLAQGKSNNKDT